MKKNLTTATSNTISSTKPQQLATTATAISTTPTITMKPSSSSSTLPSSASKSPSVSFFDLEGRFQRIFNCGGACSTSSDVEAEAEYALLSGITTTTTTMYHQASYDADESEREEDQTESARDYFERISKLPVNKDTDTQNQTSKKNETKEIRQEEEEEPQPTTAAATTATATTTLKKSLTEVVFQFVKPTPQFGSYLKRTDSDSTQSTQAMSIDDDDDDHDDDGLSFTSDSESRDACEPLELVSILRRKEKHGAITAASTNSVAAGVSFSKCTVFPDPNEGPQRRKPVRRIKKRKTAMMTTEGRIISTSTSSRSRSSRASIRPHLSPILVPASGPGGFVVMKYDGTSSNNTNNMSHKDSELRRLERRAQQQQYKQRNDILLTEGFYTFR